MKYSANEMIVPNAKFFPLRVIKTTKLIATLSRTSLKIKRCLKKRLMITKTTINQNI